MAGQIAQNFLPLALPASRFFGQKRSIAQLLTDFHLHILTPTIHPRRYCPQFVPTGFQSKELIVNAGLKLADVGRYCICTRFHHMR